MMRRLYLWALAALLLAGCASNEAYIQAQKDAMMREADARVAEAQAMAAIAPRLDAGGAAAYMALVARGGGPGGNRVVIERPRDWLDYLDGVGRFVANVGAVAVPIVQIRESNQTIRAGYDRDIGIATVNQAGETSRTQAWASTTTAIALKPIVPSTQITVNAGGDSVVGGGTIDRRNCPTTAGAGAPGGSGGSGGSGGAAAGGPGATAAPGGAGGAATGGC